MPLFANTKIVAARHVEDESPSVLIRRMDWRVPVNDAFTDI